MVWREQTCDLGWGELGHLVGNCASDCRIDGLRSAGQFSIGEHRNYQRSGTNSYRRILSDTDLHGQPFNWVNYCA